MSNSDSKYPFIPLPNYIEKPIADMLANSNEFLDKMSARRSVREISSRPVPFDIIQNIIMTAASAPSGANKQPWTFCVVSNPETKKQIRIAAEKEELASYNGRMSEEWLRDLAPLGTDHNKPFLEDAPYLIIVMKQSFGLSTTDDKRHLHYYVQESVGLACGLLIAAIHNAGLVALTHTPSPMDFLTKILNRPKNEKPFLLIPVGYPADNAMVPDICRKSFDEICVAYK